MSPPDIVRQTVVHDAMVITERLNTPHLCRQYRTFVSNSDVESCVGFFVSKAGAEQWHDQCVKSLWQGTLLK